LAHLNEDFQDWRSQISKGLFTDTKQWLTTNVYHFGRMYDPMDFIKIITGGGISVKPYLDYLEDKYSELYGF
jgi:carboxypeptidase Taq